jgi:hypothetical protein
VQSNKNDEQETAGGSGTGLYYIEIIRWRTTAYYSHKIGIELPPKGHRSRRIKIALGNTFFGFSIITVIITVFYIGLYIPLWTVRTTSRPSRKDP